MRIEKGLDGWKIYLNEKTKKPKFISFEMVSNNLELLQQYAEAYYKSPHRAKISEYSGIEYAIYFYKAWGITELNCGAVDEIYKRGKDFHLDHIVPIHYGFENGICPKLIGSFENLQILTAKENLIKRRVILGRANELLKMWGYD